MKCLHTTPVLFLLFALSAFCQAEPEINLRELGRQKQYNILFLSLDDLRPELGCYGVDYVKSPHLDKIASEGMTFMQAHCQQAICNPSRASLLTGRYPDQIQVWDLGTHFRHTAGGGNVITLPQYLKNNNFHTSFTGKVFQFNHSDDISWSEPLAFQRNKEMPSWRGWKSYSPATVKKYAQLKKNFTAKHKREPNWEELHEAAIDILPDIYEMDMYDAVNADLVIDKLRMHKKSGQRFFLALGMQQTHLPFTAPKKFFDLYDPAKIPLPENPDLPKNAPVMALNSAAYLRAHCDLKGLKPPQDEKFPVNTTRKIRHAYLACVSYMDAQIGRIYAELEKLDMKKDTIICIWGDHGYKLGEHQAWSKMTNFEIDTRSPLIIYHPDMKNKGAQCKAQVEFVDIYPTLVDLVGLEIPAELSGKSLLPLMENPDAEWENVALSQYFRGGMKPESYDGKNYMGYSIRTKAFRYTEWFKWNDKTKKCGPLVAKELYDHHQDDLENENVALKEEYGAITREMATLLQKKRATAQ